MGTAFLDVSALEKELHQLRAQKLEVSERLRLLQGSQGGKGQGRGQGRGGGFGLPTRTVERVSEVKDSIGSGLFRILKEQRQSEQEEAEFQEGRSAPLPRLSSKVVEVSQHEDPLQRSKSLVTPILGKRLRRSDSEDNPIHLKRNKRMFGALLGTLEKFRKDAQKDESVLKCRQQAVQRAEEKSLEQSKQLREAERQRRRDQWQREVERIRMLKLNAQKKELEICYARKMKRQEELLKFIKTPSKPHLYWLPGSHNDETQALLLQQQCGFEGWKRQQMEELEVEKVALTQAAWARWETQDDANNASNNHVLNEGKSLQNEEENLEDHIIQRRGRNIASRVVVVQKGEEEGGQGNEARQVQQTNIGEDSLENFRQQESSRHVELPPTNKRRVEVMQEDS